MKQYICKKRVNAYYLFPTTCYTKFLSLFNKIFNSFKYRLRPINYLSFSEMAVSSIEDKHSGYPSAGIANANITKAHENFWQTICNAFEALGL